VKEIIERALQIRSLMENVSLTGDVVEYLAKASEGKESIDQRSNKERMAG